MKIIKDFMKVEKVDMDYYVYIPRKDAKQILNSSVHHRTFKYNWLEAKVIGKENEIDETIGLTCSNDCRIASARQQFTFDRGEDEEFPQDINIRIFPSRLSNLIKGNCDFLMTRYNLENKIWIYLE